MFILYTTEDGKSQIKLHAENDTVWLSQLEIAELFNATKQNISLHLKNIFEDEELSHKATVKESLTVQTEGKREIRASEKGFYQKVRAIFSNSDKNLSNTLTTNFS